MLCNSQTEQESSYLVSITVYCFCIKISELQSDSEMFSNRLCDTHLALDAILNTPGNYDNKALRWDASEIIILMKKINKTFKIL